MDPNRRQLGYDRLAEEFQAIRERVSEQENAFLLVVGHRDTASQLAFALPDRPQVENIDPRPGIDSQYEMWNLTGRESFLGRDALILHPSSERLSAPLRAAFHTTVKAGDITVSLQGKERTYSVFVGRNLLAWPPSGK